MIMATSDRNTKKNCAGENGVEYRNSQAKMKIVIIAKQIRRQNDSKCEVDERVRGRKRIRRRQRDIARADEQRDLCREREWRRGREKTAEIGMETTSESSMHADEQEANKTQQTR